MYVCVSTFFFKRRSAIAANSSRAILIILNKCRKEDALFQKVTSFFFPYLC